MGEPHSRSGRFEDDNNGLPAPRIEPLFLRRTAHSLGTDYAITVPGIYPVKLKNRSQIT